MAGFIGIDFYMPGHFLNGKVHLSVRGSEDINRQINGSSDIFFLPFIAYSLSTTLNHICVEFAHWLEE